MSIAITEDHRALAQTVADFLAKHQARAAARSLLESGDEQLPSFWAEMAGLGLLGLHIREERGGSGFSFSELLVVAEQLGRAVAPGPFVPTVITSAVISATAPDDVQERLLPGLTDGRLIGAVALGGEVSYTGGTASGKAGVVIGGAPADVLLVPSGENVLVVEKTSGGVTARVPANLDPSRRAAKVKLDAAPVTVLSGARSLLTDISRAVFAAEAAGIAAEVSRRRLADQRPESLDQRRAPGQPRPGHGPDQSGRAEARGHHHDGDRHAWAGRHSPATADANRQLGFQRGVLRQCVRARCRCDRAG
jgi:hypothetical protein